MSSVIPDYLHGRVNETITMIQALVEELRLSLPDARERRRYAILQAAAAMQPELAKSGVGREDCVRLAGKLLDEIESAEMQEVQK